MQERRCLGGIGWKGVPIPRMASSIWVSMNVVVAVVQCRRTYSVEILLPSGSVREGSNCLGDNTGREVRSTYRRRGRANHTLSISSARTQRVQRIMYGICAPPIANHNSSVVVPGPCGPPPDRPRSVAPGPFPAKGMLPDDGPASESGCGASRLAAGSSSTLL